MTMMTAGLPPWSNLPQYLRWRDVIAQASAVYGLPAGLLDALLYKESSYSPAVIGGTRRSRVGAIGIAQFTAATAAYLGVNPLDPQSSIYGAARYLRKLYGSFQNWPLAVAAYNWGPGNVRAFQAGRKKTVPVETAKYVAALTGASLPVYA